MGAYNVIDILMLLWMTAENVLSLKNYFYLSHFRRFSLDTVQLSQEIWSSEIKLHYTHTK